MKKKSKLLQVVAIIFIVFGIISVLSSIYTIVGYKSMTSLLQSVGQENSPLGYFVFGAVVSVAQLLAGIVGVMYKSKQSVLIMGAIYCVLTVIQLIMGAIISGFSVTMLISLILPILYMWGWYQSE